MSQLIFSGVATWSYNGRCSSEQRWKHCSDLCRTNFVGALTYLISLISLHVVGLTSHASFFMQLQMFFIRFTSGDCGENSILRLALFSNHANTAMALWQETLIVLLEHKWELLVPKHLLYWLQQISTNEVNVRILVDISINHYLSANARKLIHPQTITETFLRSRNRIASGFILYQLFLQHPSVPSLVCYINLHSSKSATKD